MGGHGALTIYLNSTSYRSCSAFAPIANPTNCPWGQKAFNGYLQGGIDEARGKYDATDLITKAKDPVRILVDYGTGDKFYHNGQLLPENFLKAAREAGHDELQVRVRSQEGYDHSYYFVSCTSIVMDNVFTLLGRCHRSQLSLQTKFTVRYYSLPLSLFEINMASHSPCQLS